MMPASISDLTRFDEGIILARHSTNPAYMVAR